MSRRIPGYMELIEGRKLFLSGVFIDSLLKELEHAGVELIKEGCQWLYPEPSIYLRVPSQGPGGVGLFLAPLARIYEKETNRGKRYYLHVFTYTGCNEYVPSVDFTKIFRQPFVSNQELQKMPHWFYASAKDV